MIALQQTRLLATLVGTLALCPYLPAKAQSTGTESATAQIEAVPAAHESAADIATAQAFDTALQDYERCHWLPAFQQFVRLAERDHVQAARMAMQMVQHGPGLFGRTFALSPGQVERFTRLRWQAQLTHATNAR